MYFLHLYTIDKEEDIGGLLLKKKKKIMGKYNFFERILSKTPLLILIYLT